MLIYNVHLMYGGVFGCRKFLRAIFAHVRGSLIGNITKLPGCIFGTDVVLARRVFRRNSCCTPGLSAWQRRRLVVAESPGVRQLYCRKLGHTVPFARVFGNCLKVLQCRLPGVSARLGLRRYIAKKSSGAAGPGLFARAFDKAAPETRLAKNPGFWH